jgi:multidrug resistance protein, MATE family
MGGALRAQGRQHVGAAVNLLSYYAGALPLGILLAFHAGWRLAGLWAGQCLALYIVGALEWALVAASDWPLEVRRALARLDEDEEEAGDVVGVLPVGGTGAA